MNITCSGQLVGWKVAGMFTEINGQYSKLKMFQKIDDTFVFVNETELGRCGSEMPKLVDGIYTCQLLRKDWLLVKESYIIGIYLPPLNQTAFEVNFTVSTSDQINFMYSQDIVSSVDVSRVTTRNTPQVNLDVLLHTKIVTTTNLVTVTTSSSISTATTTDFDTTTPEEIKPNSKLIALITVPVVLLVAVLAVIVAYIVNYKCRGSRTKSDALLLSNDDNHAPYTDSETRNTAGNPILKNYAAFQNDI